MSTTLWTDPITEKEYDIGTVGIESLKPKGFLDFFQNIPSSLSMIGNIVVPTCGLWADPGCPTGARLDIFLMASDAGLSHSQVKYAIEEADALVNCKIPGMKETLSS